MARTRAGPSTLDVPPNARDNTRMDQQSNKNFDDHDPYDDPGVIEDMVRDGLRKELKRTDLSDEDRSEYEHALETLDQENPDIHPA